jgi:hypothetical protein
MLARLSDSLAIPLPSRCIVGRGAGAYLQIEDRLVSQEHATIHWDGAVWRLRDLGSRNRTYVGHFPVATGTSVALAVGDLIGFGRSEAMYQLVDATPPDIVAVSVDGQIVRSAKSILVLPSVDAPLASIYFDRRGWVLELVEGTTKTIADQSLVTLGSISFRCHLPGTSEVTPLAETRLVLANLFFRFGVSRNEERVETTIVLPERELRLEHREHNYLLLTLARARAEDASLPPDEQGWREREDLSMALRLARTGIDVAIHRARKQIVELGVEDAAGIVEVRRRLRRFGTARFEITTLNA